jgi:ubiquinone/menaquinone biosynthesis C-methylase UbiE
VTSAADDPVARVRDVFDRADGEWDRLRTSIPGRVSFEIHRRFLDEYLAPGARVLEIGAGPGIFTQHMARRGARLTVTDLSPVQLADNQRRTAEAGLDGAIEEFAVADIRDLSRWADASFDVTVAYGGPLSYVFEDATSALRELLRVTRADGTVVASVIYGDDANDAVLRTGDLRPVQPTRHRVHDVPRRADRRPGRRGRRCGGRDVRVKLVLAQRPPGADPAGSRPGTLGQVPG